MSQKSQVCIGINPNQIYKLLSASGVIADTRQGYSAFRNLIRCPIIEVPNGKRRACRIDEDHLGNTIIERIELGDGKEVMKYLETLFEGLKRTRQVRNQYEFADFVSYCGGDLARIEGIAREFGEIAKDYDLYREGFFQLKVHKGTRVTKRRRRKTTRKVCVR